MMETITKGSVPMEIKKLSISAKRQITIPQKFFTMLGFDNEAECTVRGNELLEHFKKAQSQIRPAVEKMLIEAEQTASSKSGHITYKDVFGMEAEE